MTKPRVQRRLAAIAIVDVVGYSRMMGVDESGTLAALNERRRQVIEPVVDAHDGRIVKMMGDGFFLEFASAVNAVEAALDLQDRMAAANSGLPEGKRIVLRVGINLGEVIVEGDDLFGDGVNVAARLESIAPHGGIAISGSAYEQVKNRVGANIEDLGTQALKNIAEPVHVYLVSAGAQARDSAPEVLALAATAAPPDADAPAGARPSIAILPFANLNDDAEQGYFSDGITEDIITELSRWRLLSVSSRSASFRYRGVAVDMAQVARELDVRYIVEGSVRRIGNRIRITAQLIDCETGSHIWADKFDRDAADIFSVQDQVVRTIVSTLVGRMQISSAARARRKPPSQLAAYECVLQGNSLSWNTPEGLAEATRLFEQAVAIDPGYGFAHAMLAAMRSNEWIDSGGSDALLEEAFALAKRAVELDENESTCFSILGQVCLLRRSFDLAHEYLRRAIELNPGNQWNTADMGLVLIYLGEPEQALDWLARAREIDPYFDPAWFWRCRGQACMMLQRYDEALAMFEHVANASPRILALSAACHARLGDKGRAAEYAQRCLASKPGFSVGAFMAREPYKKLTDATQQADSLLLAGLPADQHEPSWIAAVLQFWFGQLREMDWFAKSDELDMQIRDRFLATYENLVASGGPAISSPRASLAAVVVLDQLSRNMFRGDRRAFSADPMARRIARSAIDQTFDRAMTTQERMFLYLPFQHSENAADQADGLQLMSALDNPSWTRFAIAHKQIIDRFGRFPHRNAQLGRESTAEEIEMLKGPMSSF